MTGYFERNGEIKQLDLDCKEGWESIGWVYLPDYVEPIIPVPEPLTPEQLFDSQLCINTLFRKFITSLAVYSDVSSTLVYLLQTKKPDNDGKYFNYFWCIRIYLVQGLQASKISQADYDRVLTAFTEQNINLEDY